MCRLRTANKGRLDEQTPSFNREKSFAFHQIPVSYYAWSTRVVVRPAYMQKMCERTYQSQLELDLSRAFWRLFWYRYSLNSVPLKDTQ